MGRKEMAEYQEKCARVREQVRAELSEEEFEEYCKLLRVRTDEEDEILFESANRKRERLRREATPRKRKPEQDQVKKSLLNWGEGRGMGTNGNGEIHNAGSLVYDSSPSVANNIEGSKENQGEEFETRRKLAFTLFDDKENRENQSRTRTIATKRKTEPSVEEVVRQVIEPLLPKSERLRHIYELLKDELKEISRRNRPALRMRN